MRLLARTLSVVFHPLLILTYILVVLLLMDPILFGIGRLADLEGRILLLRVFISTFFIPAFAVAMLTFLGLASSIELPDREDRYGPYIVSGIFYLWMFRNFLNNPNIPDIYTSFVLGAVVGLFLAFLINIFSKISAHAVGMGGLIAMVIILIQNSDYQVFIVHWPGVGAIQINLVAILLISIFLAGLVGTLRLYLKAHQPMDIFGGYMVGFTAQLIAARILLF